MAKRNCNSINCRTNHLLHQDIGGLNFDEWILHFGVWNDSGRWQDDDVWID